MRHAVTCLIHYRNSRFSDKALVGNDKCLSETTKPCWKQQSLVRNDKALSASLSFAEKNLIRSISRTYVPCRKKTTSICLPVFVVFLWYSFTLIINRLGILVKIISETTKPSRKLEGFVGNEKGLPETTKLCRKRQRLFWS